MKPGIPFFIAALVLYLCVGGTAAQQGVEHGGDAVARGRKFAEQGKFKEAAEALREAVARDPKKATNYTYLSWALIEIKETKDGIAAARTAIELDPTDAGAYNNLGWGLITLDQYEEGMNVLRKALELSPRYYLPLNNLGWALIKQASSRSRSNTLRLRSPVTRVM